MNIFWKNFDSTCMSNLIFDNFLSFKNFKSNHVKLFLLISIDIKKKKNIA